MGTSLKFGDTLARPVIIEAWSSHVIAVLFCVVACVIQIFCKLAKFWFFGMFTRIVDRHKCEFLVLLCMRCHAFRMKCSLTFW